MPGGGLMDAIRAELEHIYQLVNQREADLAEREEALAAAARAMAGFDSPKAAMGAIRNILNCHAVDHARAVLDRWGSAN